MAGLLVGFINGLPRLFFPIVAVLYGVGSSDDGAAFIPIIIGAILAVSLLFNWVSWTRFRYYTGEEDIRIESGLISRNARSIPYERIQDVGIEQKPLARLFGLGEVKFETGSGSGDEGKLSYVTLAEAERLRELVREQKAEAAAESGAAIRPGVAAADQGTSIASDAPPIFAMDTRRVFTLGLYSFSLIIFAILGGAAQQLDFLLPFDLYDIGAWLGLAKDNGDVLNNISWSARIFAALMALLTLIAVGVATGIIRTFLREYAFRLDRSERGFRRRRGLLTLTDVIMPIHRVQAVTLFTGPIRKLNGWYGLKFISLAGDSGNEQKGDSDHVVAPLATMDEIARIAAVAGISLPGADAAFVRGKAAYWLNGLVIIIPLILAAIVAAMVFGEFAINAFWLLLIPALLSLLAILQWRLSLHRLDDNSLIVKDGWWQQRMSIAPQVKVQTVEISQGPLSRLQGLCKIHFGIADGSLSIPGLKLADARVIATQVLKKVAPVDYSKISGQKIADIAKK